MTFPNSMTFNSTHPPHLSLGNYLATYTADNSNNQFFGLFMRGIYEHTKIGATGSQYAIFNFSATLKNESAKSASFGAIQLGLCSASIQADSQTIALPKFVGIDLNNTY